MQVMPTKRQEKVSTEKYSEGLRNQNREHLEKLREVKNLKYK